MKGLEGPVCFHGSLVCFHRSLVLCHCWLCAIIWCKLALVIYFLKQEYGQQIFLCLHNTKQKENVLYLEAICIWLVLHLIVHYSRNFK